MGMSYTEQERREAADMWSGRVMSMGGQHAETIKIDCGDVVHTDNVSIDLQCALNRSQRAVAEARKLLDTAPLHPAINVAWPEWEARRKSFLAANAETGSADGITR